MRPCGHVVAPALLFGLQSRDTRENGGAKAWGSFVARVVPTRSNQFGSWERSGFLGKRLLSSGAENRGSVAKPGNVFETPTEKMDLLLFHFNLTSLLSQKTQDFSNE